MGSSSAVGTASKKLVRMDVVSIIGTLHTKWKYAPSQNGEVECTLRICNEFLKICLTDPTNGVDIRCKILNSSQMTESTELVPEEQSYFVK